jgi:hypothetical protein
MNANTKVTFTTIKPWSAAATTNNDRVGKYNYKRGDSTKLHNTINRVLPLPQGNHVA